jgi:16S rRNA (adenine1518-N6/adenine1519-N6)-dimethyltransferase
LASELLVQNERVVLLYADALKNKNHLQPRVLEALAELRGRTGCKRLKLVANLPYAVATPVITNFLLSDLPFERMVVTVQWEIAERLMAQPGSKEFSSLAVLVQSLAEVELIRRVGRGVFYPKPKVDSAIVLIRPDARRRAAICARLGQVQRLRNFLRDLYTQRRKNLRGALSGLPSGRREKEDVDRKLADLGISGAARAETLSVEEHMRLCEVFG